MNELGILACFRDTRSSHAKPDRPNGEKLSLSDVRTLIKRECKPQAPRKCRRLIDHSEESDFRTTLSIAYIFEMLKCLGDVN